MFRQRPPPPSSSHTPQQQRQRQSHNGREPGSSPYPTYPDSEDQFDVMEHLNDERATTDPYHHAEDGADDNQDSDCHCFFLQSPFGASTSSLESQLEQRKNEIAALVSSSHDLVLQIVDLEYSVEPLLLLDVMEELLQMATSSGDNSKTKQNHKEASFPRYNFTIR